MNRRSLLAASGGLLALTGQEPRAQGAEFPSRVVRIVVPNPPGGLSDTYARLIAERLAERWSRPVIVENRPGAGGLIAGEYVARAAPDGYTLVMGTIATHALTPILFNNPPYDPAIDFIAIALVAEAETVVAVHPSLPVASMPELIAFMRAAPQPPAIGTVGAGTGSHLAAELFKHMTGLSQIVITHYRGAAPMMNDLLAGHIQVSFVTMQTAVPQVRAGALRGLAVAGDVRSTALPLLPTVAEAALPGFVVNNWIGIFAPARTPPEIVRQINAEVVRVMQRPEMQQRLPNDGTRFWPTTPEEFARFVAEEAAKWGPIARAAGARLD